MNPVDHLTRCSVCDEHLDPLEDAHTEHEPGCDRDWCRCSEVTHGACCRECNPPVLPGQVEAFPDVPMASTRGLPKRRSA